MTWTLVQHAENSNGAAGSTLSVSLTNPVTSGNLVFITVSWGDTSTATITDNLGASYTILDPQDLLGGDNQSSGAAGKINITTGPQTFTLNNSPATSFRDISVAEFNCTGGPSAGIDQHNSNQNTGLANNANFSTPSVTTTVNGELICSSSNSGTASVAAQAGSTFTLIGSTGGEAYEFKTQSTAGAVTGDWTNINGAAQDYIANIITFKPAASGATPTWGWQSRREDERPIIVRRAADEITAFFRPSQIPVPARWLPTTGQEDRPPPAWRRPDDSSIESPLFFRPSQNPVPTTWLPTTGQEDRPPAQKRPPDEPTGYFFQKPGTVAPPSTWLPTTGEEDRPPHPNRIRSPDEPYPWFVRSPNPVPAAWLPTSGEEDRPAAQKRPPDEPGASFRSPASFQPILLPTTGQEDRPPPPRSDLTQGASVLKPPAPPVGISGMAWWRSVEQYPTPPAPPPLDYHASWSPQRIIQITRRAFDYVIRARRRGRR